MSMFNIAEHQACYCYDNAELSQVEVRKIDRTKTGEISFSRNEIVFILEGKLRFTLRDNPGAKLRKGQLVFLPAGDRLKYKAVAKSMVLIVRMNGKLNLCHTFSVEKLYRRFRNEEPPGHLVPLEINAHLWNFANSLTAIYEDGLKCKSLFDAEESILLLLIRSCYTDRELHGFFYPVLSPDTQFAEFVRVNHLKYGTVNNLAEAMKLTPKQFSRQFKAVFHQPPYQWMQQEKARLVYRELCETDKPFKGIAADYGFPILNHFYRFCKEAFGKSAGEIRENKRGGDFGI